jgi:hypothetical protein
MKKFYTCVYFIVLTIIFLAFVFAASKSVFALGISHSEDNVIFFQPNAEKSFYFMLRSIASETEIELSATGDLKDYVTLSEISEEGVFIATVRLPEEIEKPGVHKIIITAEEVSTKTSGSIAALTAVAIPIKVIVPYPGKYIEATLNAPDINVNDTTEFVITVISLGEENITSVRGYVSVYSPSGEEVASIETEEKSLQINSLEKLHARWQATDQKEGLYSAVATVAYDGATVETEKKMFRIGALVIKIIKVTEEFEADKINPFILELKSEWANKVPDLYAEVKIIDKGTQIDSFETLHVSINPFERKEITAYWNTKGIKPGIYNAGVVLHYADSKIEKSFEIIVKEAEKPKEGKFPFLTLFYIAIVILFIVVYYTKKKKKRD